MSKSFLECKYIGRQFGIGGSPTILGKEIFEKKELFCYKMQLKTYQTSIVGNTDSWKMVHQRS